MNFYKKTIALAAVWLITLLAMPQTAIHASANSASTNSASTNSVSTNSAISNEAQEHILSELRKSNIPNAAIAYIKDDEVSFSFKDSTPDTLFQIGSVAKSFTGFGVMLLEDMGLISVSDSVNKHLPWFEVYFDGVAVPHDEITIGNLLHHTSGFANDERHFPPLLTGGLTDDEFISKFTGINLSFEPSLEFVYSNVNYVILALLIQAVSGSSFDEFLTQNVLLPLGLHNTFTDPARAWETGLVIGGNRLGFLRTVPDNFNPTALIIPTGFIYSSLTDMVSWAQIHLGMIEVSQQFERVIQRSHELSPVSGNPYAQLDFHYAAGWVVHSGYGFIEHNGATPGYSAALRIYPESDVAVVFLSNMNYSPIDNVSGFILDAIDGSFNELPTDFFVLLDIIFTSITAIGIVFILLLVRLFIKLIKRKQGGEKILGKINPKIAAKLISLIVSIIILAGSYLVPPAIFNNSRMRLVIFEPASSYTANIALWIIVIYCLCSFLNKLLASKPSSS
ncbi:MAG: beta-lactamase family protein [Lachnospiraceae bacterium]|nr:beta-lactamase family protein [Lachnospiraceae bacterium]